MKFVQLLATNILFSKTFMCIRLESIPDPPCCTWLRICWVYRRAGDFCTCEYLRNLDFSVTPNFRFLFPSCRPIRLFSACQLYCSNCLTVFLVFQNADHGRPAESFLATRSSYFLISGIFLWRTTARRLTIFPRRGVLTNCISYLISWGRFLECGPRQAGRQFSRGAEC